MRGIHPGIVKPALAVNHCARTPGMPLQSTSPLRSVVFLAPLERPGYSHASSVQMLIAGQAFDFSSRSFTYSPNPIVRRVGSKSSISGSSEERFLFEEEFNHMKGVNINLPTGAAIMPSPVFLWRFKVLLFFMWGFCCCKVSWDSVMRMSVDLRDLFLYEAFLYYNPLLLTCATWMTIVVPTSMTAYLYLYSHGEVSLAASQPVILYAIVLMLLIFPFDIFYLSSRYYLLRTVWRIMLPLQAITFSDFFLADIMTSMSKVATIAWFEADSICGSHSVAIPVVLVFPYLCRFFQCLRQYKDTKEKTCLLNGKS
ncbi:hypothetical protein LUZ60_008062 [Juncus effusus]|nr:hypothetical protein LUZ60_008062 [Juncus effusus]